jgi:hypothetical protein
VDLPVPGQPYTFGIVADAQALGGLQALKEARRRVAALHVPVLSASPIRDLIREINFVGA